MRESERILRKLLSERGFRECWAVKAPTQPRPCTLSMWVGRDCKTLILQSFGEEGWELFRPVSESGKLADVTDRLEDFLREGEAMPVPDEKTKDIIRRLQGAKPDVEGGEAGNVEA